MSTTDKPKRRVGRPPKPAHKRVSECVTTTLTPADMASVRQTAELCDEAVGTWVRGAIQTALKEFGRVPEKDPVRVDKVLTEAEKESVRRAADAQGVPVPVWLRQAIQWALEDAGESLAVSEGAG